VPADEAVRVKLLLLGARDRQGAGAG
jgi:hypothetical protein